MESVPGRWISWTLIGQQPVVCCVRPKRFALNEELHVQRLGGGVA